MITYYKITRNSETGRKFKALDSRCAEVRKQIAAIGEKYGFGHDYYTRGENAAGGVVAVCFPEGKEVDAKLWKSGECGYRTFAPHLKGEGKKIREELNACGEVTRYEYNDVMGVGDIFHLIGVDSNDEFYVVAMNKSKSSGIPADAVEITASEFSEISNGDE